MEPVPLFKFKCVLVVIGAMAVAVAGNEVFTNQARAIVGVIGAGSGALMAYLLKTTEQSGGQGK